MGHAPLGDTGQLSQGNRQVIGTHSHGLAMEIASGQEFLVGCKNQGVIRDRVDFALNHAGDMRHHIANGPMHLGHTAQTIGVLQLVIAVVMRCHDVALRQNAANVRGHRTLARMWPRCLYAAVKGGQRPEQGFQRDGADDICAFHEVASLQ